MKICTVKELLNAEIVCGEDRLQEHVYSACGSDMMSDVLAFPKEHMILLTGLVNHQVIRTCDMLDIRAVCFTRGKLPTAEALEMANEDGISVIATDLTLFIASGKLYSGGMNNGTIG
jgi:hypothetical protein